VAGRVTIDIGRAEIAPAEALGIAFSVVDAGGALIVTLPGCAAPR
jgi:hypothetical protein